MSKLYSCDICHAPMKFIERLSNYKSKRTSSRRRRFACTVCDYTKVIYADGYGDEISIPQRGVGEVKRIQKQEEVNRKR